MSLPGVRFGRKFIKTYLKVLLRFLHAHSYPQHDAMVQSKGEI